jgi:hypothetical protein
MFQHSLRIISSKQLKRLAHTFSTHLHIHFPAIHESIPLLPTRFNSTGEKMQFLARISGGEEGPHRVAAGSGRSSAGAGRSRGRRQHVGDVAGASRSGRWPRRSPAAAAPGRRPPSRPPRFPAALTARRRPPPAGPGGRRGPPSWLSPPAQDHACRRSAASPALALRRLPWATLSWLGQPEK